MDLAFTKYFVHSIAPLEWIMCLPWILMLQASFRHAIDSYRCQRLPILKIIPLVLCQKTMTFGNKEIDHVNNLYSDFEVFSSQVVNFSSDP